MVSAFETGISTAIMLRGDKFADVSCTAKSERARRVTEVEPKPGYEFNAGC